MSHSDKQMLVARIRKDDHILRDYFNDIKQSDRAYEVRRLLEKAIIIEQKEKEEIRKLKEEQ
ncbi:hypothetical protein [Oceanobacillus profundus]|uniref:Uncharacterized protein n=1 Tax=Oceanobacillus profundus TaxID=372463 RepID=A0A417YGL9_9BACI|nr:hypothetical protein [Oceanobacillus profundus]MBR2246156.1 hypothetical protein [Bacilli bacterium]MBR3119826.1 hypothetical protein [Oceanobacillus sp.]RHW31970.1 hypothetical protein D1B32_12090 [Oceanobacillus profundus]